VIRAAASRAALRVLAITLVGVPVSAGAQRPLVRLDVQCPEAQPEELRRVVRVELRALLVDEPPGPDLTRVRIVCKGDLAALTVDDPLTAKALRRVISLTGAAPAVKPRLLGLAVAELVAASWIELALNPTPALPPAEPPASARTRAAGRAVARARFGSGAASWSPWSLRAVGAFNLTGFTSGPVLMGGGIRLGKDLPAHLALSLDLMFVHGSEAVSLGRVATDLITVAPALLARVRLGPVDLRGGLGFRVGGARLTGSPADPATARAGSLVAAVYGPMLTVSTSVRLWRFLLLEVAGEAGWVVRPIGGLVAHQREVSLGGAFLGFQLGLGFFS
jgi:hypothetical protein